MCWKLFKCCNRKEQENKDSIFLSSVLWIFHGYASELWFKFLTFFQKYIQMSINTIVTMFLMLNMSWAGCVPWCKADEELWRTGRNRHGISEEPGELQSRDHREPDTTQRLSTQHSSSQHQGPKSALSRGRALLPKDVRRSGQSRKLF